MKKYFKYIVLAIICLAAISWAIPFQDETEIATPERVKIALREVGNQLLLRHGDSTSIILPVRQTSALMYELSFEKELTIMPENLVAAIDANFEKAGISKNYIVEVLDCEDQEVSYSYAMSQHLEKTIIPCSGRRIEDGCHRVLVQFTQETVPFSETKLVIGFLALGFLFFVGVRFRESIPSHSNKQENTIIPAAETEGITLGSFQFYPEQHKLIKDAQSIQLSNKECELLIIFVARPNEVIKREELSKSVWEDNGVIVGRSLDTYISKLRKHLKADPSLKIANIHGVGYRLEIN